MMRRWIWRWVRVLLGGAVLFATAESGCLSETLRNAGDELDSWADDLEGEEDDSMSGFLDDLDELFD